MTAIQKTNGWLNLMRDGASGANSAKITYVAFGSGTNTPAITDTQLGNETFRKAVTSFSNGGTGETLISVFLGPSDMVGMDIEEVGFYGGSAASSVLNSGTLLARGLYSHNPKSGSESITFTLDMTVS